MKTNSQLSFASIIVIFSLFTVACTEEYEIIRADEPTDPDIEIINEEFPYVIVKTHVPTIQGATATFSAEIIDLLEYENVSYGFMWYNPNLFNPDGSISIEEITVGTTSDLIIYTAVMEGLPLENDMIVCSFVRNSPTETFLGDEISF